MSDETAGEETDGNGEKQAGDGGWINGMEGRNGAVESVVACCEGSRVLRPFYYWLCQRTEEIQCMVVER